MERLHRTRHRSYPCYRSARPGLSPHEDLAAHSHSIARPLVAQDKLAVAPVVASLAADRLALQMAGRDDLFPSSALVAGEQERVTLPALELGGLGTTGLAGPQKSEAFRCSHHGAGCSTGSHLRTHLCYCLCWSSACRPSCPPPSDQFRHHHQHRPYPYHSHCC